MACRGEAQNGRNRLIGFKLRCEADETQLNEAAFLVDEHCRELAALMEKPISLEHGEHVRGVSQLYSPKPGIVRLGSGRRGASGKGADSGKFRTRLAEDDLVDAFALVEQSID